MKHHTRVFSAGLVACLIAGSAAAVVFNCAGGDSACLIAAINSANANGEVNSINLGAGTYALISAQDNDATDGPSGLPAITSRLTITGADPATTVIQRDAGLFRIFRIVAAGDLTLENLTVRRGTVSFTTTEGGGLLNRGKLTISNSTVTQNEAVERRGGGISNYGSLTIRDSTISENSADLGCCNDSAGGIFSNGSLTISHSRVIGNHDADGAMGGIFSGGTSSVIESSTISGNSSDFGVGGVIAGSITNSVISGNAVQRGVGGVVANTIVNTTIAGNSVFDQGVGGVQGGSLTNCTVVANFAADPPFGPAGVGGGNLKNTILAGNIGGDCSSATSLGNNIIGDPTGCTITLLPSDLTGDPGLGAFQDDGTPGNGHTPLLPGSQAVDAGDPASCSPMDQLGQARVDGDGDGNIVCDIGAIEATRLALHCAGGDVSCLIAAIREANVNPDPDTILLDASVFNLTVVDNENDSGANGLPVITTPIRIQGSGATGTFIQRESASLPFRILEVGASGNLTLESLTIQSGETEEHAGGGIINFGIAAFVNCDILNSVSDSASGGGISNLGKLSLTGSRVAHNSAPNADGGGIDNSGTMTITQSTITDNSAKNAGGISNSAVTQPGNATLTITSSTIANNEATAGEGGGISNHGPMTLSNSAITGNRALGGAGGQGGGGISNSGNRFATLGIDASTIAANVTRLGGGGGVDSKDTAPSGEFLVGFRRCTIVDNRVETNGVTRGGGISGPVAMSNTMVARNIAETPGGGTSASDCFGPVRNSTVNLVGDPSGCTFAFAGEPILTGDPGLRPFRDDGTPGNGHFPLLATSQAIDAGVFGDCLVADQLGQPRVDGDGDGTIACDTGAIEFVPPVVVNDLVRLDRLETFRDLTPVTEGPAGTFTIEARLTNTSSQAIHDLFFQVAKLSGTNRLLNADGAPGGVGATLTPDVGADGVLSPGESVTVTFVIGLQTRRRFSFFVDVLGVPGP
jgi:hypothetical protein